nr:MAG TPA: Putative minor capsid protein [Microviridae sp.]
MGFFDAIAATVGNFTDNMLGMINQNHQNKVNQRMMREQNTFNAEQSQLQRDWQERMWNMNNAYNSPDAMIARGLNPFIEGSAAMAGSRAPASGGAAASAAPVPSMQAFRPNFSNVFNSLASLAQAKKAQSESNNIDAITPQIANYYKGLTNWKNLAIGESGFWNKETGRISAALDQSTEAQELKNLQFAERLSAAQETQILLNSDAQRTLNRYLDQQQQADLFIKGQTLINLQLHGALTEKQIQTELQRAILTAAQASGQKISNDIAANTAESLIKASNAAYELQYRDASYDSANVKLRKHIQYDTDKARQRMYEYGADLARKQGRTHYWESVAHGLSSIASGAGNIIGSMRPGAQVFRNDYGPRNTTIYNGMGY